MRWLKAFASGTGKVITKASTGLNTVAAFGIAFLMVILVVDVSGRFLFDAPVPGTIYICQYVLIISVYCGVAYCAVVGGHVVVDVLVSRFRGRVQAILGFIKNLIVLPVLSILVYGTTMVALYSKRAGEVSLDQLRVPAWPFRFVVVLGAVMLCLVLLMQTVHLFREIREIKK